MYKLCPGEEEESSGNDRTSVHSSFWSDGREEEEEEEVVERVCHEEDSAPAASSVHTPLNPAVASEVSPPASQWESSGHRGEASHGSGDEDGGDGDDEGGSDDDDGGGDEDDGGGSDEDGGSVDNEDDGSYGGASVDGGDGDNDRGGDDADDAGLDDDDDDDDGDKAQAGENRGSPALSHLTSGYGTYRPDSASKDTEAGTIAEFDRETLAESESDEEDLHRFYCDDPSPAPRLRDPLPTPRSPDPTASASGTERRSGRSVEEEECPAPDRKSSADRREDPLLSKAAATERFAWRSEGDDHRRVSELEERRTDGRDPVECSDLPGMEMEEGHQEEEEEEEEDREESCSNTDIRFIDSHLEPGCAGATVSLDGWEDRRPRDHQDESSLEERFGGLRVSTASARRHGDDLGEETENDDAAAARQSDDVTSQSDGRSSDGLSLSAFESFVRGMVQMQTESTLKPRPKSFIRPALGHPHTRNLKKTDPVARYLQYKQEWDLFKVPWEKDRRALRWEIREQLAYQPPPARPRRVNAPNSYIVPTEKKRSALRWEIRNDLANGLLPKHNYRF
ncbi:Hydrolethalus syndrome protein 1 [Merluccius polli]|uniref:Hydrolethalus syndrome protein 1 n=1 Tax=Merluccius polli TaxID=89951 RepID=A0AA47M760_MERPO|nr:Hydrolethalus syndrome protein 1 [Merluccius polli]